MNKTIKKVLFAIGFVVVLIFVFFVRYGIKAQSEVKTMTPVASGKLTDNIFAIQDGFANVYLVQDCIQYIVIDAGNKMETISEELEKLEINPDLVAAVFLTHSDGDHVAAISLFKNAKVYLSLQEEQMISGETSRFFLFGNTIDTKEYNLIEDQQIISIGNITVKGFLNPGHTPGSMSYLINNKYLFTGDAVSLKNGKIDKFNEFFNMDTERAIKSIEIISNITEAQYIFTAHHGYSDDYLGTISN